MGSWTQWGGRWSKTLRRGKGRGGPEGVQNLLFGEFRIHVLAMLAHRSL